MTDVVNCCPGLPKVNGLRSNRLLPSILASAPTFEAANCLFTLNLYNSGEWAVIMDNACVMLLLWIASSNVFSVITLNIVLGYAEVCPWLRGSLSLVTRKFVLGYAEVCPWLRGSLSLVTRKFVLGYAEVCPWLRGSLSLVTRKFVLGYAED